MGKRGQLRKTFFDEVMVEPKWMPLFNTRDTHARARLVEQMEDTTRFDITNIFQYMQDDPNHGKRDLKDMMVLAPTFNRMWFEYNVAGSSSALRQDDGTIVVRKNSKVSSRRVGWYVTSVDIAGPFDVNDPHDRMRKDTRAAYDAAYARDMLDGKSNSTYELDDESRWILTMYDFGSARVIEKNRTITLGPNFNIVLTLDKRGRIQHTNFAPYFDRDHWFDEGVEFPQLDATDRADAMSKVRAVLFAMTFMNCRNVVHETVKPEERQSRFYEKKKGRPLTEYRLLKVDVTKDQKVKHNEDAVGARRMPLHICRGHFRVYTAEKPLFGHYVGPVWVPAHTRGSAADGTVVKDYELTTGD